MSYNFLADMKTRLSKLVWSLGLVCLAGGAAMQAQAQTRPSLGVKLAGGHTSLSITGTVGAVYTVQYAGSLSRSNSWQTLTNLTLSSSPTSFIDLASSRAGNRFYRLQVQGLGPNPTNPSPSTLLWIAPGTFTLGSPAAEVDRSTNEGPQTVVTISRGFLLGKYPVTQADYQAVVGTNPSYFTSASGYIDDLTRPVEQVSWNDATNYCVLRTQQERAAGLFGNDHAYRLPTEAEWEYACRAGSTTSFYYGDDPSYTNLAAYAWYGAYSGGNSAGMTHSVGQKLPNAWGLYDMAGNVEEWCQDWYGPYPGGSATDPQGAESGTYRVLRGGGWGSAPGDCRSAWRGDSANPTDTDFSVGFRVVFAPTL
jgi:formylglycine-generating enzyme required for sulfatase activity